MSTLENAVLEMLKYRFLILNILFISCSSGIDNRSLNETFIDSSKIKSNIFKKSLLKEEELASSVSVFSKDKIFISIFPSNKYLDSIQKTVPGDEWNEVASDNEYYRDLTKQFLDNKGYKHIDRPESRFWQFKLKNGIIQVIDTVNLHDKWGNLIFNGKDSAFIFDSTSPEIEIKDKL